MPLKKVLIAVYFGEFPPWFDLFLADFQRTMAPQGYKLLLDTDLPDFKDRVRRVLGIDCPIVRGTGKPWDYRGSLGVLYEEDLKGYDYIGHCDFDMVFGQVSKFISDEELSTLDVYSSHNAYVCGCFSLYKNTREVNHLFRSCPTWQIHMQAPEPTGWIETDFSRTLEISGLKYKYDLSIQGNPWLSEPKLVKRDDGLFQEFMDGTETEVGFFHFRHSKRWPL